MTAPPTRSWLTWVPAPDQAPWAGEAHREAQVDLEDAVEDAKVQLWLQ